MRYTNDIQIAAMRDINAGDSIVDVSKRYGIPSKVLQKWVGISFSDQKAKAVTLQHYAKDIADFEAVIEEKLTLNVSRDISDKQWFDLCETVNGTMYNLVTKVVKKERNINIDQIINPYGFLVTRVKEWGVRNYINSYTDIGESVFSKLAEYK